MPPTPEPRALQFEGVSFAYGATGVLRGVSLAVEPGQLVHLVGPSGSGKTTLLKLAHGELRPAAGRLVADGIELHRPRRGAVRELRRRHVGVVFQDGKLLERLTALENVTYALRVADLTVHVRNARRRAAEVLRAVGLAERMDAYPPELSGGQRQRVAIARALAPRPPILLADEPTASLDQENAENVVELLDRAARGGTAVLVASCDRELPAAEDRRVVRLVRGEVVEVIRGGGRLEDFSLLPRRVGWAGSVRALDAQW